MPAVAQDGGQREADRRIQEMVNAILANAPPNPSPAAAAERASLEQFIRQQIADHAEVTAARAGAGTFSQAQEQARAIGAAARALMAQINAASPMVRAAFETTLTAAATPNRPQSVVPLPDADAAAVALFLMRTPLIIGALDITAKAVEAVQVGTQHGKPGSGGDAFTKSGVDPLMFLTVNIVAKLFAMNCYLAAKATKGGVLANTVSTIADIATGATPSESAVTRRLMPAIKNCRKYEAGDWRRYTPPPPT